MASSPRRPVPFSFWVVSGLALLGFVAWLLWPRLSRGEAGPVQDADPALESSAAPRAAVVVGVAAADKRRLAFLAQATGRLEAWREVSLGTEVGGRVQARAVEPGQRVGAGAELLRLDPVDREIELSEAAADLLKVQANYALVVMSDQRSDAAEQPALRTEPEAYEEARRQFAAGLIPRSELDRLRRRAEAAVLLGGERQDEVRAVNIGLLQAEQRLERARLQLARTRLLAPFAGRVADLEVEVGQQLTPGQRCLSLLDDSRLKVAVDVLERDLLQLSVGAEAKVRIPALDQKVLLGTVYAINPRVDPASGTGKVIVAVENPRGELLPGVFAFVELATGLRQEAIVVPESAVLSRQGRELVFRIEGGRALWTWVKTGGRGEGLIEVLDGLTSGQKVAVSGHEALAHETAVRAEPVALPPAENQAADSDGKTAFGNAD